MSAVLLADSVTAAAPAPADPLLRAEKLLLSAALALLVALPLAETLLRRVLHAGIPSGPQLVQHLTLIVTMLGAAAAARDGQLLTLFEFAAFAPPRVRAVARAFGHWGAAAVSVLLILASIALVASEREAGTMLGLGIPRWVVQLVMPAGFAVIMARLLWRASARAAVRAAGLGLLAAAFLTAPWWQGHAESLFVPAALALGGAALAGAPIFAILAGAALLLFWRQGVPIAAVALDHYRMIVNPSLPAIPLFTLAGFYLAAGRAPTRLTLLFQALFGHFRGGVALAAVVVGAFFTALTGASGVTILALGGVLLPLLTRARYRERDAIGLVTVSGSAGTLLPPCLPIVLYAIVARIGIVKMFLGALLPALLIVTAVALWGMRRDPRSAAGLRPFEARRAWRAICLAKWDLALPLVVFGSLFGGFATPVEAAALTALYVLTVETLVHPGLRGWRHLSDVASECGALVGGVLLILGVALALTNYLVDVEWPSRAVEWATHAIHSRWLFLLALNVLLLLVGCVMEIWSAIVVLPPVLVPLGAAFGVDPVHLGVIFLANLELGYLTPLVGVNLFYSSARFGKPILEVCRDVLPLIPVLAAGVLAITYLPWLSTALAALAR
ncbi:MAG TPA: TRAP transporter large permease subunit [Steroidobacteraceae bacterium]|nr:TRAP transporter large permease subunit [Steroidobacteraceae bacterium]